MLKKIDDQCFTPSTERDWGSLYVTSVEAGAKEHYIYYTEIDWGGRSQICNIHRRRHWGVMLLVVFI